MLFMCAKEYALAAFVSLARRNKCTIWKWTNSRFSFKRYRSFSEYAHLYPPKWSMPRWIYTKRELRHRAAKKCGRMISVTISKNGERVSAIQTIVLTFQFVRIIESAKKRLLPRGKVASFVSILVNGSVIRNRYADGIRDYPKRTWDIISGVTEHLPIPMVSCSRFVSLVSARERITESILSFPWTLDRCWSYLTFALNSVQIPNN